MYWSEKIEREKESKTGIEKVRKTETERWLSVKNYFLV